jgi:excinuclease ABC subunit B
MEYNEERGIIPTTVIKDIREVIEVSTVAEETVEYESLEEALKADKQDLQKHVEKLEVEMKQAAKDLQFERAAHLRDEIMRLKKQYKL